MRTLSFPSVQRTTTVALAALLIGLVGAGSASGQTVSFVQVNAAVPQSPQAVVSATYSAAQTAGNLNVVVVGWNDSTAQVSSLVDSRGHVYVPAVGPTVRSGFGSQTIYYAKNIQASAAGSNTVTVTFDQPAVYVDLRIAEYSGLDLNNPLDVAAAATGSSTSSDSGSVITTNANDLLVGANLVATETTAAGSGYTSRIITRPDADILEDRVVTTVGSYSATAPLSPAAPWIMQMVAFRAASAGPPDTQAPTAPSSLITTAISSTQINLSWTGSSDNVGVTNYLVERCQGAGCSIFAQVGTSASLTFNNTGLTSGTSYSYRVRATDAAGNMSGYSNTSTMSTPSAPDTQAPTAPGSLITTAISTAQINLSWTGSTDNVGVTNYLVERCQDAGCGTFAQVGTSASLTFNNTGLTAGTSYSYRVRATDAAGNMSGYSNTSTMSTPSAPDAEAPTAPSNLLTTAISSSQINLSWTASTDNVAVTGYKVERCQTAGCTVFTEISATAGSTTLFSDTTVAANTSYSYIIRAQDAAGNLGPYSNVASATTLATNPQLVAAYAFEEGAGTVINDLSGHGNSGTVVNATWSVNGKYGKALSFNGSDALVSVPDSPSLRLTSAMTIEAWVSKSAANIGWRDIVYKGDDNYYLEASTSSGTPGIGIKLASAQPEAVGPDPLALNIWTFLAATYDGNMLRFYLNGTEVANRAQIGSIITSANPLQIGGDSFYGQFFAGLIDEIRIYNVALTPGQIQADMVTPVGSTSVPDIQAPSAVTGLVTSVISGTQINLSWTGSTDNVGVTNYLVERCQGAGCTTFAQVGTSAGLTFNNTGLTAGTSYSYRVRATDAAGNLSGYSNTSTMSTPSAPDAEAPTAPSNLLTTAISSSQINLSWTGSTDNVGVTSYLVERCQGAGCATFAQVGTSAGLTFNNTGLTVGTSYSYRVRATDAAGNLSGYSNTSTMSTPSAPDAEAPTAPSNLLTTAISSSQINLSWTGSTDNVGVASYLVERCQGAGCATFAQVGTSAGLTFNNIGLTAGTSYSYRVRATDAAANLSGYSNTSTMSTPSAPDAEAPTAPSNLLTTAISSSQINLSWTGSTDNVGVTNYLVERCQDAGCSTFAQVGTSAGLTFNNIGLTAGTSYSYRVRAMDAAGNLSLYSLVSSAATQGTAPSISFIQTNFAAPQTAQSTVTVPYTLAQSLGNLNVVVVGWNSSTNQVQSVTDSRGNSYVLAVGPTVFSGFATQSIYYAANIQPSSAGNVVTVVFNGAVPYADIRIAEYGGIVSVSPVDVVAEAQGIGTLGNSGAVTTTNSTDLIVGANIVSSLTTGPGTAFTNRVISVPDGDILEDRIVTATGSYSATAPMTPGSWIMQLVAFKGGISVPDTQAPSTVTGLVATAISGNQVNLSWTGATDNVGVTGYKIERCQGSGCTVFEEIATAAGSTTSFSDATVAASTAYVYRVRGTDAVGNLGGYSNSAAVSTQASDTEPPSATGLLTAIAVNGTQIDVFWGPATDNIGVAGYRLERCQDVGCTAFTKFGTTFTGTTYSDVGLALNTTYRYIVRAQDAAGNLGPYSNVATAVTLGTNPQLVAAYAFEEGAGTVLNDLSGHGNTGTIANATWSVNGKFGKALSFNGTNSLVSVADSASLRLTTGMTLEAWVNRSVSSTDWRDVVYKGDDNYYLEGTTPAGAPGIGIKTGAAQAEAIGPDPLPLNVWTFLAATYDGNTLRFYLNGTEVASRSQPGSIITSANPLQIGGDSIYGQFFAGMIDEVRIYNVALSPGQIQTDMVTPVGSSVPVLFASTMSLNFGEQYIGITSNPLPVSVTNAGSENLSISGITISGAQAADFSQTNDCVGVLVPSGNCSINVTLTPGAGGARNATLSIASNAPGNPHAIILSGTGTGFTISPQTFVITPPRTQQFTVTGTGGSSVLWSVDSVVGGTSATGTITSTGLYTPPGIDGLHTVTVATTDGTKSATGTVYVTTNAGAFTHHYDNARTGLNPNETVLNHTNVNSATFGKLAAFTTDGIAHATPLYVSNVNIPGIGLRNVVYIATEHDSVYAFDADGTTTTPLWHVSFINEAAGITTVPNGDTGECCDITPEIGITGTPVIDPATGTLYVVVKTKESATSYPQRLHALDIATGAEKLGGPVLIQATVSGTGAGSTGGQVEFNSLRENARTALLLHNGVLYFGFGSHGDYQPYHGWLFGYNATTLQRVLAFNTTPNGEGGGIWQSGAGLVVDSAGNIYFATGDGTFSANTGGVDYGDTFIRFNPSSGVVDYFTPHDENSINNSNLDLNAGGMLLLPDQPGLHPHLLVSAGKNGTVYLVDRDNMTHFNAIDQNPQTLVNVFPFGTPLPGNYSSPVYFNGSVYFGPVADVVQEFRLINGLLTTFPTSTTPQIFAYPGAALSVSANGTNNGIVWAIQKSGSSPGTLRAYSAGNLAIELYNSNQAGTRDVFDAAAKFSLPLVINGRVYVASEGQLTIYGLLP